MLAEGVLVVDGGGLSLKKPVASRAGEGAP
jgi:hypothetical protein